MMTGYDSEEAKLVAVQVQEYLPAVNNTGKLSDSMPRRGAMRFSDVPDRTRNEGSGSIELTTFSSQMYRRGRNGPLKNAQDYFITKRAGFPWATVPDFVVGRAGVDNWLLVTALSRRAAVIDASRTVTARHQVRPGYDPAAHFTQPTGDSTINYALAGRAFDYSLGLTDCAPLETVPVPHSALTTVTQQHSGDCYRRRTVILRRRRLNRYCQRAYLKRRGLHRLLRGAINFH